MPRNLLFLRANGHGGIQLNGEWAVLVFDVRQCLIALSRGIDTTDFFALVKAINGESRISVAFGALGQSPVARKLNGLRTYFCPTVYLGLIKTLTRDRVILQAAEGSTLEVPPPAIIA